MADTLPPLSQLALAQRRAEIAAQAEQRTLQGIQAAEARRREREAATRGRSTDSDVSSSDVSSMPSLDPEQAAELRKALLEEKFEGEEVYTETKKANSPYKRKDVSNLIKLVEDVIATAIGIDDSCVLKLDVEKFHGPDHGKVGVQINLEPYDQPKPTAAGASASALGE